MRRRIEALIREAGKPDMAGLRATDPDALVDYVLGTQREWWRRRPCVEALQGRVPEERVPALINLLHRNAETTEVRIALLEVLGDREDLLPWLRTQTQEQHRATYGLYDAIVKARAGLGDLEVARDASTLANSPWRHQRVVGEEALALLAAKHGAAALDAAIGDRPEDRVFRVRTAARAGGDVLHAFADPDVGVARTACELVIETGVPDDEMLYDHVVTGPTTAARLFAAYALHRRGKDVRDLWTALDCPRVEVAIDDRIRHDILREYAVQAEHRTDVRWLVEAACVELPPAPHEATQLARAVAALDAANLAPGAPRPVGEVYQQGGGTYHVIAIGEATVEISNLGPYAASYHDVPVARLALERAGFVWIDEVGKTIVDGLCVYHFGKREPLAVRDLLFYWQD